MSTEVYSVQALKRAAWQFLTGKALTAALTFIILLWLVRLQPLAEYGAYVVLIAGTELGFALAGLGLPWLAARYLPDYRLHADGSTLSRLCRRLILWQMLAFIVLAIVIAAMLEAYLNWVDLFAHRTAAWFALALLVVEGLGRFLREGLMAPLMLQAQARISLVLRQLVFLTAIATIAYSGQSELDWVLAAEAGASALGLIIAGIAIARHLRTLGEQAAEPGWQEPRIAEQWRVALRMHAAHIVTLAYGPQVFLNLVQRALDAEAAALFGFLRVLSDQVARYLPALLLFTVLRPKLISSHLQGGMAALAWQVNLVGKLSLFVLLPIIVLVALVGDTLVVLLSGSKFTEGGAYLLGLLLALVPFSQRQLIDTVAVAVGRAGLCTLGAFVGLLALPLMLVLLDMGFGLWAPVLAILFGQFSFNTTVLTGLYRYGYQADWHGAAKLGASAILAWLVAKWVLLIDSSVVFLVAACLLGTVVFLTLAWRTQAFTVLERQRLDGLLGRRLLAR
jgi:O-antigen/teichoic acid export membrane protein